MTVDPSHPAPPDWPALMTTVAECVAHLGGERFDDSLLTLLRQGVGSEQCILFAYAGHDSMECLVVDNTRYPKVAGRLARLYAGGLFRQDPNYPRLKQLLETNDAPAPPELMAMRDADMSPAYRSHLFAFPDLADKASVAIPAQDIVYYLNLYRELDRGPFRSVDLVRLEILMPLLASLIRRHYRQRRLAASQGETEALAVLSERERQLCLHLLRGHTLKTAAKALDIALSSAETYRKRAYAKLGVRSKAGLLALCRQG